MHQTVLSLHGPRPGSPRLVRYGFTWHSDVSPFGGAQAASTAVELVRTRVHLHGEVYMSRGQDAGGPGLPRRRRTVEEARLAAGKSPETEADSDGSSPGQPKTRVDIPEQQDRPGSSGRATADRSGRGGREGDSTTRSRDEETRPRTDRAATDAGRRPSGTAQPDQRAERPGSADTGDGAGTGRSESDGARTRSERSREQQDADEAARGRESGGGRRRGSQEQRTGDENHGGDRPNRSDRTESGRSSDDQASGRRGESTGTDGDHSRGQDNRREERDRRRGEGTGRDGSDRPGTAAKRRKGTKNLRTMGPLVTHFSGRVVQVFGTTQRPRPSYAPLRVAAVLLLAVVTLPVFLQVLPYLVLAWLGWMWLRHRGWIRGGAGGRRGGSSRPDPMHQVTSFRVQIIDDQPPHKDVAAIDCRLVQRATLGPTPLVGGELVTGQGYRYGRRMVEVTGMKVDPAKTRVRTAHPKSASSVMLPAVVLVALAGAIVAVRWEYLAALTTASLAATAATVVGVLVPLIVIVVGWKVFWAMRPWRW